MLPLTLHSICMKSKCYTDLRASCVFIFNLPLLEVTSGWGLLLPGCLSLQSAAWSWLSSWSPGEVVDKEQRLPPARVIRVCPSYPRQSTLGAWVSVRALLCQLPRAEP